MNQYSKFYTFADRINPNKDNLIKLNSETPQISSQISETQN